MAFKTINVLIDVLFLVSAFGARTGGAPGMVGAVLSF
jgi:hypothetical protein